MEMAYDVWENRGFGFEHKGKETREVPKGTSEPKNAYHAIPHENLRPRSGCIYGSAGVCRMCGFHRAG